MKYHVSLRRLSALLLLALALLATAGLYFGSRGGLAVPIGRGDGCRSFWGETVESAAWSRDGDLLAVITSGAYGITQARVFRWPGMDLLAQTTIDVAGTAAMADDGTLFWTVTDPFNGGPRATTLWHQAVQGSREPIGILVTPLLHDFLWAGGALVATEYDPGPPERSRLVRLDAMDLGATPNPQSPWTELGSDFWIDRTGAWAVWTEQAEAGGNQDVVVRHAQQEQRLRLPGYGGGVPTLTPARDAVIYQRSETARLTLLDLATGQIRTELDTQAFYGGEVSAAGVLAAPTAHGPWQENHLCVRDVQDRLAVR